MSVVLRAAVELRSPVRNVGNDLPTEELMKIREGKRKRQVDNLRWRHTSGKGL